MLSSQQARGRAVVLLQLFHSAASGEGSLIPTGFHCLHRELREPIRMTVDKWGAHCVFVEKEKVKSLRQFIIRE